MANDDLRAIRTIRAYRAALKEMQALEEAGAPARDDGRSKALARLVKAYERQQLLFDDPDAVDYLRRVMKARGLRQKDLDPCIGSRSQLTDVLRRRRPLTLGMVQRLSTELKLPADVLLRRSRGTR